MKTYSRKKPGVNRKVVLDLNELCRLCMAKDDGLVPIFNDDEPVAISVRIMACVGLKVSEGDGLPDRICHPCRHQLEISHAFRKECELSDFKLRLLLKNPGKNVEKKSTIAEVKVKKHSDIAESSNKVKTEDCSVESPQIPYIKSEPDDDIVPPFLPIEDAGENQACTFNTVWLKSEEVKLEQEDEGNVFRGEDSREMEEDQIENQDLETSKTAVVSHTSPDLTDVLQMQVDQQVEKSTQFQVTTEDGSVVVMELITENDQEIVPSLPKPAPSEVNEERELKLLPCPDCPKTFVRRIELRRHSYIHIGRKHTCWICKRSFHTRPALKRHERIHTGEQPFRCDFCEKNFSQKENLLIHRATHTTTFECPDCAEKFNGRIELRRHVSVVHGNRRYSCRFCKKRFLTRTRMMIHERIHTGERPYRCEFCEKSFCQKANLSRHRSTHAYIFECPDCPEKFNRRVQLRRHASVHTNRPYSCAICKKRFTTRTTLARHERIHTGERPFRCKFCAKSFTQRENLLNHYPTHAGQKPFKCPHCLREFPQQRCFRIHLQSHHNSRPSEIQPIQSYKCMVCPKVYLYASGLT